MRRRSLLTTQATRGGAWRVRHGRGDVAGRVAPVFRFWRVQIEPTWRWSRFCRVSRVRRGSHEFMRVCAGVGDPAAVHTCS